MSSNNELKDKIIEELRRYNLELEKTLKEKEIEISILREKLVLLSQKYEENKNQNEDKGLNAQTKNKTNSVFSKLKLKK